MAIQFFNDFIVYPGQAETLSVARTDNLEVTSSVLVLTAHADNDALSGAIPPVELLGGYLWIINASAANTVVINANDANSTDGYRFAMSGNITLEANRGFEFSFVPTVGWLPKQIGTIA